MVWYKYNQKTLTGKPKCFWKSNSENKFSYMYVLTCSVALTLVRCTITPLNQASHLVLCPLCLSCLSVSWRQWSYLIDWLLTLLNLPGGYLHISLTINLFATLNQHWIKWRQESYFSINKVQEPYTGWGVVILLINLFFSSLFQNL